MATLNEQRKKRARLGFRYTVELNFTSEIARRRSCRGWRALNRDSLPEAHRRWTVASYLALYWIWLKPLLHLLPRALEISFEARQFLQDL